MAGYCFETQTINEFLMKIKQPNFKDLVSQEFRQLETISIQEGQEGCYIADLGRVLAFGETAPAKTKGVHGVKCQQYKCTKENLLYTGCGAVAPPPNCQLVTDESKPFPGCCPQIKC